jgi:hypothetical protein
MVKSPPPFLAPYPARHHAAVEDHVTLQLSDFQVLEQGDGYSPSGPWGQGSFFVKGTAWFCMRNQQLFVHM